MNFSVTDETSKLKSVIIGIAKDLGPIPNIEDLYDPISIYNLKNGTYPIENDMVIELNNFSNTLKKFGVNVFRPENIKDCNQIFVRDVGFIIDNFFFKSNILPKRANEFEGIKKILKKFDKEIVIMPEDVHVEGGDVITDSKNIFLGYYNEKNYSSLYTARTNRNAVDFFKNFFPKKNIIPLHLKKSNLNVNKNILHLDCCFQLVGKKYAILYPDGFSKKEDFKFLKSLFGAQNIFLINDKEMSKMNNNILSIDRKTIISQPSFKRLNNWLQSKGFLVELVSLNEVSKQGGLFRCSSLPLIRNSL